jgi:hypothetical protein
MTKLYCRFLSYISVFALAAIPLTTMAQSASEGWKADTLRISFTGTAVNKDDRGVVRPIEIVYTGTADTPGNVIFVCYMGRKSLNFAIRPTDMPTLLTESLDSNRRRSSDPIITVDGEQIKSQDWTYMPVVGAYHARRPASFRTFYNATILGSTVRVRSNGEAITLNLPKADHNFKTFGSECGLGLNAIR